MPLTHSVTGFLPPPFLPSQLSPLTDDDHQSVTNPPDRGREIGREKGNSIMRQMWAELPDIHRMAGNYRSYTQWYIFLSVM